MTNQRDIVVSCVTWSATVSCDRSQLYLITVAHARNQRVTSCFQKKVKKFVFCLLSLWILLLSMQTNHTLDIYDTNSDNYQFRTPKSSIVARWPLCALYILFHSLSVWLTVSDALYVLAYINCNSIAFGKPKCGQVHYTFNLMLICHLFDIDLTLIWHWFDIDLILICDWFWNDFGLFRWQLTICYCLQVVIRLILDGFEFDQLMDDWNWEWKNWNTKEC